MIKEEILTKAVNLYHSNIFQYPDVLNYLYIDRGINQESIAKFKIGYCDGSFYKELNFREAAQAGVVTNTREWFKGYITFPVFLNGQIKNIYGRAFGSNDYTHTLLRGSKKEFLFNYEDMSFDSIFIVESPLDCITLVQNGFKSIATFGCKIPFGTNRLFKDKHCYILYDTDSAGKAGAVSAANNLCGIAKKVFIVSLPEVTQKNDVNQFFANNKKAKERLLFLTKRAKPFKFVKELVKNKIEEIDVPIVSVGKQLFQDYLEKTDAIWVRCPHHGNGNETKRSLWIGGNKNIFTCFGCGISGGPVKLVSWHLGISEEDARKYILQLFEHV